MAQAWNATGVAVANDVAGTLYAGCPFQGCICTFQHEWAGAAYWLFISKDQSNEPLGEMRPLGQSGLPYNVSWASNGANFPTGATIYFAGWHPTDGTRIMASPPYNSGPTPLPA